MTWAETAYGRFLATIDPEISRQYRQHKDEVTVAVFGKTQVGKTTLILTLMGIAPQHMGLVSRVLRGGRPKGRSATATAMLYSRSLDECWHLVKDGQGSAFESPDGLEARLGELRLEMEAGRLHLSRPLQVMLPGALFEVGAAHDFSVNIIDLPGDSPAGDTEQRHVSEVAARYVPNADLVLLVGKADDLGFIDPEKMPLPGLGDWRYSPSRYRIITTFSIQSVSFRDWLSQQDQLDALVIRKRLLAQLGTFDEVELPADARETGLYFPLEFGESWSVLHATDPALHARVQPVMAALLAELKRDIQASASPHMRLWRATQVHVVANRLKRARQKQVKTKIDQVLEAAKLSDLREQRLLSITESLTLEADQLPTESQFEDVKSALVERIHSQSGIAPKIPYEVRFSVEELLGLVHECVQALVRVAAAYEPQEITGIDIQKYFPTLLQVRVWVEPNFETLRQRLNSYTFDAYQPWLFNTHDNDISQLRSLAAQSLRVLREQLQLHWERALTQLQDVTQTRRLELTAQAQMARRDALTHQMQAQATRQQAQQMSATLAEFSARMERDEATGRRFVDMLKQDHAQQFNELKESFRRQPTSAGKFVMLLALEQLEKEKTDLFSLHLPCKVPEI